MIHWYNLISAINGKLSILLRVLLNEFDDALQAAADLLKNYFMFRQFFPGIHKKNMQTFLGQKEIRCQLIFL